MPGRDGTGPAGAGAMTGRSLGGCAGIPVNGQSPVFGMGCRRRAGRGGMQGRGFGRGAATAPKEALEQQRAALQARLDQVDDQLKSL